LEKTQEKMGKQFSRVIYIRRDTIHQSHSMLASSIGTYRPVIVLEVKFRELQTCDSPGGEV
jgi:hypothetical protein